jgi:hypothetical protein
MSKVLRPEVNADVPGSGGLTDLFDGLLYTFYNITSEELDIICENATDEEISIFIDAVGGLEGGATICEIRKGILVRNKYVPYYQ